MFFVPFARIDTKKMFQDAFIKLNSIETKALVQQINPSLGGLTLTLKTTVILAQDLPFYPEYRFLDITDAGNLPAIRAFVIHKQGHNVVLNWTNEPIYTLNETVPIQLNAQNVLTYAHFFFTYVRGRYGRFIIIETVDDIQWKEEPPPAARRAIAHMLEPLHIQDTTPEGGWILGARMLFRDSLFKSLITVEPNGQVTLSGEELLIEDMPILDDVFGQ